ncbi:hypothetical protein AAEU29_18685 [Pseudoalteromonas sp. SSM20]|uniref:hypothetical protein n=1 Tax=Pseudoalteromonas sp. SSM20 TaxID=3139394 RepID=UPI003BAD0348
MLSFEALNYCTFDAKSLNSQCQVCVRNFYAYHTLSWFIPVKTTAFRYSDNKGQYATGYKTPSEIELQDYDLTDVNSS